MVFNTTLNNISVISSYQLSVHLAKRFREDFIKSANQKEELPVSAMFVNGSGQNVQSLERAFHRWVDFSLKLLSQMDRNLAGSNTS
jgi:hypothetical protein